MTHPPMPALIDWRRRSAAFVLAFVLAACGSNGPTSPDSAPPPGQNPPGQQPPPTTNPTGKFENPQGPRFSLPEGIELVGKIGSSVPVSPDSIPGCWVGDTTQVKRIGRAITPVNLCFRVKNTTGRAIEIRFPPRVIFIAKALTDQNGVLLEPGATIIVPAGKMMWIEMWLFCINEKRSASRGTSEYEFGPVTDDAQITEIQTLMNDKSLKNPLDAAAVQYAVWEVSDRGGLTDATRQRLRNLPVGN